MSNDGMLNSQPCGGPDNDDDGCGVIFPRVSPGTLLFAHLKGTLKQCFQCGICGTNISDPCGTCKRKGWCNISTLCITSSELTPVMVKLAAHDENGISDPEAIASQAPRCNAIEGRLHRLLRPSTPESKLSNFRDSLIEGVNTAAIRLGEFCMRVYVCRPAGSIDRGILHDTDSVLTIFDPMTHTPLGESGLGDHGFEGIRDFVDSHECSAICRLLKLCEMSAIRNTLRKLEEEGTVDEDEDV
ncbi:hypothetical protein BDR03DRAFT_1016858 [Suillus americanus]|nr:hypothetical protein BDR03DRAFT_1016858 [Suillus americanus]